MTNGTYSMPVDGSGSEFCVVTESNIGSRGWVLSPICSDDESDYGVYEFAAYLTWADDDDPDEVGTEGASWDGMNTPTDAVDEHLKDARMLAFYSLTGGGVKLYGDRGDNGLAVLYRVLKQSNNLL